MNPQQHPDDPIRHVILVMFENHSFDQMLGCFKRVYPDLDGVTPENARANRDTDGNLFRQTETRERQMIVDPHHEVNLVEVQMQDDNSGFVLDFSRSFPKATAEERRFVMGYYPLDFLPALHRLARDFLISDRWFSSLPGPTWPNRFFALTGTSLGRVNMPEDGEHTVDFMGWFQQDQITIFDRLSGKGISWKVYFHDIPQPCVCCISVVRKTPHVTFQFRSFSRTHSARRRSSRHLPSSSQTTTA